MTARRMERTTRQTTRTTSACGAIPTARAGACLFRRRRKSQQDLGLGPERSAHTREAINKQKTTFHHELDSGMWRGMMVPNACVKRSSEETPDLRFERTLCRLKKNRARLIIMSNSQKAYLELLRKKDCSESRRFRHTLCGWMYVDSALTLPVPYG